ncbi:substrate-binding protein domain-containing protein [Kaistia soli DSM 19436]|uniref:Substrate-binding protein domain-containing protein n=1 Tax=Kaistia soli DSM 19436 TaxID=1122133 RepID=A0A1M5PBT0_9HYPH|nr:substrate-binding domain-containing protein [Kaistia soli]SHG99145.1 substrate-binding protein domain-containing protein [Kaistia soli DSM 19436]
MRLFKGLAAVALLASVALAAGSAEAQDLAGKKIGIAAREITNDYNRDIIAGATAVLKDAGAEVVVTDGGTDPRKHNENIESLINSGVAGIIVQLGDPQQLAPVVAKANAAGIPVITTSIGSKTEGAIADVGGDEALMATMLARSLLSSIDYKGNVIGFWVPGAPLLETRKRVFEAILADYPNVKVQWVPTEHSAAKVQTQMEDLLTANPEKGSIAGVWGAYDLLVSGAVEAVRRSGRDEIKIASIDGDRIGFQMLLDEGSPYIATVVQDVPAIGRLAGENIIAAVGGKKDFPSAIFTEVYVATHANGVAAAEKRWGPTVWDDTGIAKADVEARWPQDGALVVVRPVLP